MYESLVQRSVLSTLKTSLPISKDPPALSAALARFNSTPQNSDQIFEVIQSVGTGTH